MKTVRFDALSVIVLVAALFGISTLAESAPQDRIRGSIDGRARTRLKGNIHPKVRLGIDKGAVEPWMKFEYMKLVLKPSAQQQADLEQFLEQQRDPSSADYRHWLTPEEFGDRFGLDANDVGKIVSWLQAGGFTVEQVAKAKNWIAFSGTAAEIATAFQTGIHRYSVDGESHFANAVEPSVPAALANVVERVRGLNDFRIAPPKLKAVQPGYTTAGGIHYLAPDDLATIYNIAPLYQAGFDGAGQTLVIAGQTDINLSDVRTFRSKFGLPARDPQLVLYGKDPGISIDDQMEASLDLEWSGAVARNATIVYVYSKDVVESLQYAIDQNLGTVISMSYGECETDDPASFRSVAQQANAQGITWMNSSGDSGAAGCDSQGALSARKGPAVDFPANIPEVTGVGGTTFDETGNTGWGTNGPQMGSATGYLPEMVWNDSALTLGLEASVGGASTIFSKPWWQAGPGVPNDNARDVPDVSLAASADHDGYMIYAQGGLEIVGGTSASSPTFAGIITLLNQYLVAKGFQAKPGSGNINPTLYRLAQSTPGVFHDITTGDNMVPCRIGTTGCTTGSFGYQAAPGYDLATGLGSVDAYNLVTKWANVPPGTGTTMSLTASSTSISTSGTTQLTATVTPVSGSTAPTGTVTFLAGGQSLGSAGLTPAATGTAASAMLTVSGVSLSPGNNTLTATYAPTATFSGSTASIVVAVAGSPLSTITTVTANPTSIASTAATQLVATVKPASGSAAPTGSVTFSAGNTTLGTVPLTGAGGVSTAMFSLRGSSLVSGNNSINARYIATGSFASSSGTVSVTLSSLSVATTLSVVANPPAIGSGGSTQVIVTVKAASGNRAPTGSVTMALGNKILGTSSLLALGSSSIGAITVRGRSLASGSNQITVSYLATGNFGNSSGSTTVTVTTPGIATTLAVNANPASIANTGSTLLTATVNPTGRGRAPAGNVTFSVGNTTLGTIALEAAGASSVATLTVQGDSLASGGNTITATYAATGNFANSSGSTEVTVIGTGGPGR